MSLTTQRASTRTALKFRRARRATLCQSARFSLPGKTPQDSHFVMVLPVLGPDLDTYYSSGGRPDLSTRLQLARDILQAVACLHAHNFVHRGMSLRGFVYIIWLRLT